jgi:lysozyme
MKKFLVFGAIIGLVILLICSFVDLKPSLNPSYEIKGIDISHYNKITSWKDVGQHSNFCIIKSTQGSGFKDPKFVKNWSEAKKHNIVRGAYHFFQPGVSAEKQFENFRRNVILKPGDLPPVLDVELKECNVDEINKWLQLAENHYKVKPILYTEHIFFKVLLENRVSNKYPLWIYVDEDFKVRPSYDNYDCVLWQCSHTGKVNGIQGDVDLDMFIGSSADFKNLLIK